jgi:hypothetical protein
MYALNALHSYDYTSSFADPRLISSAHSGQRLTLDAPVLNGQVKMANVYADRPGFSSVYNSLADIGGGQITYYYDSEIGIPFIKPLFDDSAVIKVDYIDPMGTYKPHYYRDSTDVIGPGLTWLADTQFQREDILAAQQWRRNQSSPLLKFGITR